MPILIFFVIIIAIFLYRKQDRETSSVRPIERQKLPYKKKDYLLTVAEKNFYWTLNQVAEKNNVLLFAKVRLEDLLWLPAGTENRFGLRNRIKSRHIDFVLCDKENVRPLLAVELDDSSHSRIDRIESDYNLDNILGDAGLPILRQKFQHTYVTQELENRILSLLKV